LNRVSHLDVLVLTTHELSEETDEWNETGYRGGYLLVHSVYFESLIIENQRSPVCRRYRIDAQRQIALVALRASGPGEENRSGSGSTDGGDELALD
jgi:hypothetical protein